MSTTDGPESIAHWERVRFDLPLPLDLARTITSLIGSAYPSTVIDTSHSFRSQMVLAINPADRRAKPVGKRKAAALKQHQPDDPIEDGSLTQMDAGGTKISMSHELRLQLGGICADLLEAFGEEGVDVENYIEWSLTAPATEERAEETYVLWAARGVTQTPHALRTRAEEHLRAQTARLRALADDLEARCPGDDDKHTKCVGARVRAAIGTVGE